MAIASKTVKLIIAADERQAKAAMQSLKKEIQEFSGHVVTAGAAIGAAGLAKMAYDLVTVNAEYQKLNASLKTVTGSAASADAAFSDLRSFAANTPFQLTEVVQAFIRLKALGLDPSNEALLSYGNTASAMGKTLEQVIEAVADASVGEFERLKEFGVKAKSEGENVTLTFQGVSTKIGKNAGEITNYLQNLGKTNFAGAMTEQMNTLGGAFSNLQDAYANMLAEVGGNSGINSGLIDAMRDLTTTLQDPTFIQGLTTVATLLAKAANAGATFVGEIGSEMTGTSKVWSDFTSGKIGIWDFMTTGADEGAEQVRSQNQLMTDALATGPNLPSTGTTNKVTATSTTAKIGKSDLSGAGGLWESLDADQWEIKRQEADLELERIAEYEESGRQIKLDSWQLQLEDRQDVHDRENEMFAESEEKKSATLEYYTDLETSMRSTAVSNAVSLLSTLGTKSKAAAIAAMVIQRGLMIGETITSGAAAELRAIAELGPIAGPPAAATIRGWTYANVGLIAATGIASQFSSSSSSSTGTTSSSVVSQPVTVAKADPSNTVNVTILGNVVDHDKFAREVIPSIQKAFADGVS